MQQSTNLLKSFVTRLAKTATSEQGAEVARLLRLTGLFASPQATESKSAVSAGRVSQRVGIWEQKTENGKTYFTRDTQRAAEWNLWANVGRINPKGARRRVALLGESVARGFLYDPQFTPASALQMTLRAYLKGDEFEVIDLARTSLRMTPLESLAESALLIEPDAVVIFAGNNWAVSLDSLQDVRCMTAALRERHIPGLKQYVERRLAEEIGRLVRKVASIYEPKNIPVIWIIPEYNLGDWRDPQMNAPWLSGEANQEWLCHWDTARDALAEGRFEEASESARKMIDLDHGVSATGLYILAECSWWTGEQAAARAYFERARDALIWDPYIVSFHPRSFSVVQNTLREEVRKTGNEVVDLPRIFSSYLQEELPDRRMFLDYCHLTAEGIRVAMAATAARLLKLSKGREVDWTSLIYEQIAPTPEAEAEAAFLAAIHNAHGGQSYDLVFYHCARAVEASPKIAKTMRSFIDAQTRRAPMLMCKSAEEIASTASSLFTRYLLFASFQLLDRVLLEAIVSSLKTVDGDAGAHLTELRRQEHSVTVRPTDLLDPYYCRTSLQEQELRWKLQISSEFAMRNDYYKSYGSKSRFFFIGEADRATQLRLTCRLPGAGATEQRVLIEVNGRELAEITARHEWATWEVMIPQERVRDGVNEVVIRWPVPAFSGDQSLEQAADALMKGSFPEFFPVFGEIHSLVASDACEAAV